MSDDPDDLWVVPVAAWQGPFLSGQRSASEGARQIADDLDGDDTFVMLDMTGVESFTDGWARALCSGLHRAGIRFGHCGLSPDDARAFDDAANQRKNPEP